MLERLRIMRRRLSPIWIGVIAVALAFIVLIGAYGTYLANAAGRLPWQEEPTRIPITPFADIPGFGGTPAPTEESASVTGGLTGVDLAGIDRKATNGGARYSWGSMHQGAKDCEHHGSTSI